MRKWRHILALFLACLTCVISMQVQAEEGQELETAQRIQKAEELGLLEWIDEEGYLTDEFFAGKSDSEISNMSLDGLVQVLTEEEIDAYAARLKEGISLFKVSKYKKVSQINPYTGRTLYTGLFEVDGILAYCIEREEATPPQGSPTSEWISVTNDNIRKVLYYGYNGPADCGYTFVETAMAVAEANGKGDNSLGRAILAEIKEKELPPKNFLAWKVETNGGSTQELAFYTVEAEEEKPIVNAQLTKVEENSGNVLAGATFRHTKPDGTEELLTTGTDGKLIWENLAEGIHRIEEVEAPAGYFRNRNPITFTVDEKHQITVTSKADAASGDIKTEYDEAGNLLITVENKIGYQLPDTGSYQKIIMYIAGTFLAVTALQKRRMMYEK